MNAPTRAPLHPSDVLKNTGTPTTNQMSRAPKRKNRAADSTFTARVFANRSAQPAFCFAVPIAPGNITDAAISTASNAPAITTSAPANPAALSKNPPRKKPQPFNAFFDPVSSATHRNSAPRPSSPVGTSTLIALFALIFVRSFAIPDSACAAMT